MVDFASVYWIKQAVTATKMEVERTCSAIQIDRPLFLLDYGVHNNLNALKHN